MEIKDLGHLGVPYQFTLVKCFTEYPNFFRKIVSVVDQNMFTEPNLREYVGLMKDYYNKYDSVPSYNSIVVAYRSKRTNSIDVEIFEATVKKIIDLSTEGLEQTMDLGYQFFRQQACTKISHEIVDASVNGKTDVVERLILDMGKAINIGDDEEEIVDIFQDEENTLSQEFRKPIPTGMKKIDEILEGGISNGELGIILGSSSFGKTSVTTAIDSYASTFKCPINNNKGFKVLQIVFEDKLVNIKRKHFARLSEVEAKDLSKPEFVESVRNAVDNFEDREMMKENLKILKLYSGEYSVHDIRRILKRIINQGFKPDLVTLDYFECLKLTGAANESKWDKQSSMMRSLESMASEFDLALWVCLQGNRESFKSEVVTMDQGGGSIGLIQIGHLVLSISRNIDEQKTNRATLSVLKNRAGKAGIILKNVYFNNGTCCMSTDDAYEEEKGVPFESLSSNIQANKASGGNDEEDKVKEGVIVDAEPFSMKMLGVNKSFEL